CTVCAIGVRGCVGRSLRGGVHGRGSGCCCSRIGISSCRGIGVRRILVVGVGGGVGCLLCRGVRIRGRVRGGLRGGVFVGGGFCGGFGVLVRCCRCRVVGVLVSGCLRGCFGDRVAVVIGVRRGRGRGGGVHIGIRIRVALCIGI